MRGRGVFVTALAGNHAERLGAAARARGRQHDPAGRRPHRARHARLAGRKRQPEPETGSSRGRSAGLDRTTGALEQKPHEGEAESATGRSHAGTALAQGEDRLPLFRGNPGTVVVDPKFDVRATRQRRELDAPTHATVLYRILEHVDQDLNQCVAREPDFDFATRSEFEPRAVRAHLC